MFDDHLVFFCAGDYVAVSAAFIAAGSIYDLQQRKPGARAQTAPGNKMLYLSFYISANIVPPSPGPAARTLKNNLSQNIEG